MLILLNDYKCISLINYVYVNLVILSIFEYSENFPNSGFTSLIFPIGKALGPLPKIAKKIPGWGGGGGGSTTIFSPTTVLLISYQ